jgi:hypothetical protein
MLGYFRAASAAHEIKQQGDHAMTPPETNPNAQNAVGYKTVRIEDQDIFYREAGPSSAPVILLLHGLPTSSKMYRNLIPRLAGSFHVVVPDYARIPYVFRLANLDNRTLLSEGW